MDGASALAGRLESAGFGVEIIPALEVVPPSDLSRFRNAITRVSAGDYDWIILTSRSAVLRLAEAFRELGAVGPPAGVRFAVVGNATARELESIGWTVDLIPEDFSQEGLVAAFAGRASMEGARVLFAAAEAARDVIATALERMGATVDVVVAYRTIPPPPSSFDRARPLLAQGSVDLVTLTSPSAASNLLKGVGEIVLDVPCAVIGPVTESAAQSLGYDVVAVAREHTIDGLVAAVRDWAGRVKLFRPQP